jgi:hypothetical protein
LGGLLVANSIAGSATADLIMFGWTNPTPYNFFLTSITIDTPLNQVAAVATTDSTFIYGASINNTSPATLAAGTHFRVGIPGSHRCTLATAINAPCVGWNTTPATLALGGQKFVVYPGRGLTIFTRELVGTATATETYLWNVNVIGRFE